MSVAPLPVLYDVYYLADGTPYISPVQNNGGGYTTECPVGYIMSNGNCISLDAPPPIQETGGVKCPVGTKPDATNTSCIPATTVLPIKPTPTTIIPPLTPATQQPNYLLYIGIGLVALMLLKN